MSRDRFFVGQRVRIVKSRSGRFIGLHGTVTTRLKGWWCVSDGIAERGYGIDVDGFGIGDPAKPYYALPDWIKPIPDDAAFQRFMANTLEPLKVPA